MGLHFHILYDGQPKYTAYTNVYTALIMARGRQILSCTCGTYNIDHRECTPEEYVRISNLPLDGIDGLTPRQARGGRPIDPPPSNQKKTSVAQMRRWHRREVRMEKSERAVGRISRKSGKAYLG